MFTDNVSIWPIFLSLFLWLIAAFVAAVETSILSLRKAEIYTLAEHSRAQKSLRRIADEPYIYSYSLNLVRLFTETVGAAMVGITCVLAFNELWLAILVALVIVMLGTFLLVGFSPRQIARAYAPQTLKYTSWVARLARFFFGGLAKRLYAFGTKFAPSSTRFVGFRDEEQLLTMVDEAAELEMLEEEDRELIHSVFEFGDTVVREVMVPRIDMITLDSDQTLQEALDLFLEKAVSRIPVIGKDADEVLGIVYLRDVVKMQRWHSNDWGERTVKGLVRTATFVPESKKADDALKEMQAGLSHLFLVIDEYGGVAGLVTLEDLIEELVGEIADEYDREEDEVKTLEDGSVIVSAKMPIDELGELFDLELEDEEVDSVGGWLTKLVGSFPEVGTTVHHEQLELVAERIQRRPRRVLTVRVRLLDQDPHDEREHHDTENVDRIEDEPEKE